MPNPVPTNWVRATHFFIDTQSYIPTGWSETRFLQTPGIDLAQAIIKARTYAGIRQQLLATGIKIAYIRVSNDNTFRDSQIVPGLPAMIGAPTGPLATVIAAGQAGPQGAGGGNVVPDNPFFASNPADFDWTAVLVRGEGPSPYTQRSMFWLSGVPDALTWNYQAGITDPVWVSLFNLWVTELKANWAFPAQVPISSQTQISIQNITQTGSPAIVTVTAANHGFSSGNLIRIAGVKTIQNLGRLVNGSWQIQTLDNNNFTLVAGNLLPTFQYGSGGVCTLKIRQLVNFANVIQRRMGSRRRGRPFGLLFGRRRVKRPTLTQPVV